MLRRGWRSRPAKSGRRRALFIALLIFFLFTLQSIIFVDKHLRPPLMNVAKLRVKQIATQSINSAITERIAQGGNFDKLIDWRTDKNGKNTGLMFNYMEHSKILSETVGTVQGVLNELKEIPEHIPVGQAFDSPILASFGPKIPIKFTPVGSVKVDLSTRQQNAGINMVLMEVYIRIMAEVAIIIPFDTEPEMVETEIPISYVLVVGDVPMYYYDNNGNPSGRSAAAPPSIAIPQIKPDGAKTETGAGTETPTGSAGKEAAGKAGE
ncbi:sporulation protein YunB [Paenibacillus flagellatus]|uniref:Sporulation protein YunB n=1 Tax=Paenibacillus flagellatus TaxID=2211139 RepID=A0A2V5KQC5_9BACL|nr:sporulation protein YunB [Paenibacillus flagellatus]PYI50836.1 sporulation protein YunB [Paenibacillus flagellatus]